MDADLAELFRAGLTTWDCQVLDDVAGQRVEWCERPGGRVSYRRWWQPDEFSFCTTHMERLSRLGLLGRLDPQCGWGAAALTEQGMLTLEAWLLSRPKRGAPYLLPLAG